MESSYFPGLHVDFKPLYTFIDPAGFPVETARTSYCSHIYAEEKEREQERWRVTVFSVNDFFTTGIRSGRLSAQAENISMYDANVNSDLLRDGCSPPSVTKTQKRAIHHKTWCFIKISSTHHMKKSNLLKLNCSCQQWIKQEYGHVITINKQWVPLINLIVGIYNSTKIDSRYSHIYNYHQTHNLSCRKIQSSTHLPARGRCS